MRRSWAWAGFTGMVLAGGGATTYVVIQTALSTGQASAIAAGAGFGLLWTGGVALYARERPKQEKEPRPVVTVDWHLSDVHGYVTCPCSPSDPYLIEGYMFGRYRCKHCGVFYQLPDRVEAHERRAVRKTRPRQKARVS